MAQLFVYGSLCFPDVLAAVTGVRRRTVPAYLPHHVVRALRNQPYPGLLPVREQLAHGALYRGLSRAALKRLDAFEGRWYRRGITMVNTDTGRTSAFVYRLARSQYKRAGTTTWRRAEFDIHQRRRFAAYWQQRRRRALPRELPSELPRELPSELPRALPQ